MGLQSPELRCHDTKVLSSNPMLLGKPKKDHRLFRELFGHFFARNSGKLGLDLDLSTVFSLSQRRLDPTSTNCYPHALSNQKLFSCFFLDLFMVSEVSTVVSLQRESLG